MSRVELSDVVIAGSPLLPVVGASVQVNHRSGGAAIVYSAATGGGTKSNPLTSDAGGRIEGWVEPGSYDLVVDPPSPLATYTERFEASPGADVAGFIVPNVKSYGALGDGSTDDSTAFNAALAAANGGKVYAPTGVYILNAVAVPDEGITIVGDGIGSPGAGGGGTVLKAKAGATAVLRIIGKRYCALRDLVIDGNERASWGLEYQAAGPATNQTFEMTRVRFYRCNLGWFIGPGSGGVNQADKNTLVNTDFIECNYGVYFEGVNSQNTVLVNCDFGTIYQAGVYMLAGSLTMIGGQFQGQGQAGARGIQFAGYNVDWVRLQDVIFEGPDYDVYDGGSMWPKDGLNVENTVFQGPTQNVLVNSPNARMSAKHSRFNADNVTIGGGVISWNQAGGRLSLEACEFGAPNITGAVLPTVSYPSTVSTSSTTRAIISEPEGGKARAFEVVTDNPFSAALPRFQIENNQDTPEIDINVRGAVLNIGDPNSAVTTPGCQINFMAATGDTSVAWSILKIGEGPAGEKAMWASRTGQIQSYGYGVTSVYFGIRATSDSNDRFRIQEASGEMRIEWGPGGSTAVDTSVGRQQAGVLGLRNALHFPVAVTAASVPNNTIFRDSADNVLKRKDNSGTVAAI